MSDITLWGTKLSGHAHRVELLLRELGLPYDFVDTPRPARTAPEFLALNPLGQIPVLRNGEIVLADSAAILVYLARRYDPAGTWLPQGPVEAAAVQRFLAIAAGEIANGPALARSLRVWAFPDGADFAWAQAVAARVLAFMDRHLANRAWLATPHPTIADLACYSYVAAAPEGDVPLDPYPAVRAWLGRVEALPRFVPLPPAPA